jgi:hypothetical protein
MIQYTGFNPAGKAQGRTPEEMMPADLAGVVTDCSRRSCRS